MRVTHSRKALGQPGLQEQLYSESLYRATHHPNSRTALDLALCYGYGTGTNVSWPDCETWIRAAASLGNEAALVFFKRLNPKLEIIAGSGIFQNTDLRELLVRYYRRMSEQKSPEAAVKEEVAEVVDLLLRSEPDFYEANHGSLFGCPCTRVDGVVGDRDTVLNQLWGHVKDTEQDYLHPDLAKLVNDNAIIPHGNGRTLLHDFAACRHPHFPEDTTDTVRRIGELLLMNGCALDASFIDATGENRTPLSLALESRNLSIVTLLSERQEYLDVSEEQIVKIAVRHDYQMLDLVFSPNHSLPLPEKEREKLLVALRCASHVPVAERKLRHGGDYIERGQKTMDILYQYNYKHRIMTGYSFRDLVLGGLVSSGGDDLVKHFFTNRILPLAADSLRPQILNRYLINSIQWGHRELFSLFLRLGADTNQICPNAMVETAWEAAALVIRHDYFYFDRLLVRGADWKKLGENGMLMVLVMDPRGADAIKRVLTKYPQLLQFDLPWSWSEREKEHSVRILNLAVRLGFPATVTAVLEACAASTNLSNYHLPAIVYSTGQRPECLQNLDLLMSYNKQSSSPERIIFYLGYSLVLACKDGNIQAVKRLLELGADPNFLNSGNAVSLSPIIAAIVRRRTFTERIDTKATAQCWFEEKKFNGVRRLLLDAGLAENRRFGARDETADEFCRGLKNLH
jgi:hypothetical protein